MPAAVKQAKWSIPNEASVTTLIEFFVYESVEDFDLHARFREEKQAGKLGATLVRIDSVPKENQIKITGDGSTYDALFAQEGETGELNVRGEKTLKVKLKHVRRVDQKEPTVVITGGDFLETTAHNFETVMATFVKETG